MPDFDMTPYAAYVWPAWGLSLVALGALTLRQLLAARRWKRVLDRLEKSGDDR